MIEHGTPTKIDVVAREINRLMVDELGEESLVMDFRPLGEGETADVYVFTLGKRLIARVLSKSASEADLAGSAVQKLRKFDLAPSTIYLFPARRNALHRDILIVEEPTGETLSAENFTEQVFSDLVVEMLKIHHNRLAETVDPAALLQKLRLHSAAVQEHLENQLPLLAADFIDLVTEMEEYLQNNEGIFRIQQSLLHADLYWANVLVNPEGKAFLIDWLGLDYGDYCHDLATFKVGFLRCTAKGRCFGEEPAIEDYFRRLLDIYRQTFEDQTLGQRLRFYLAYVCIGDVYAFLRGHEASPELLDAKVIVYLEYARRSFMKEW